MKIETPMQKHIEFLKKEWLIVKNLESLGYIGVALHIGDCIEHAESMLEKEKEVMQDFATDYERECRINLERSIEKCWDETFNTKDDTSKPHKIVDTNKRCKHIKMKVRVAD